MAEEKDDYIIEDEDDDQKATKQDQDSDEDEVEDHDDEGSSQQDDDAAQADSDDQEDDREAIRERRRLERKHKKEAQRERDEQRRREIQMLRQEKDELAGRLAVLERRAVGSEMGQLDAALEQTSRAVGYFKEQIKLATEAGDGGTVAEATEKMMHAQRHIDHLNNIKRQATQQARQTETHSPIDPMLRANAESWMVKNAWYNPQGGDPDSRVALVIDQAMAEEGWDPRQPEYWDELDSRLKRYLPHRFQRDREPQQSRRSAAPVASGGREGRGPASNGGGWKLSADRVAAIKEAGAWDDPVRRDAMIKRFREYDKQNAGR